MAARSTRPSLVVIVGPTASGKSELAMRIAEAFNGEIIAADSRTVYKGMDIGTAKPTKADQSKIKHWGLDLVEPGERFTAAMFKSYAEAAIGHIQTRGKLPVVVGGTGLYIDGLLHGFSFVKPADPKQRQALEALSTEALQMAIQSASYRMPSNSRNRRHLIRTIERQGQVGTKAKLKAGVLWVGLLPEDETLKARINQRAEDIFVSGIAKETTRLCRKYGQERLLESAGIVYKIVIGWLGGDYDQARAIELFKTADWQYARRQKTWFRRNKHIKWFAKQADAETYIRGKLRPEAA